MLRISAACSSRRMSFCARTPFVFPSRSLRFTPPSTLWVTFTSCALSFCPSVSLLLSLCGSCRCQLYWFWEEGLMGLDHDRRVCTLLISCRVGDGWHSEAQSSGTLTREQSDSFLALASSFLTVCAPEQIRLAPDKCKFGFTWFLRPAENLAVLF